MKATKRVIICGWMLVSFVGAGCSIEVRPDPIEEAARLADSLEAPLLAELEGYYDDLSGRDWPAFASHFWTGATITTAWQPPGETEISVVPQTVEEFVEQAPEGPGSREIFEEWIISSEIKVSGNLAHAWVRYGARFGDPGDVAEWEGIDSFALLNVGGTWKIAALVFDSE